jgi:hypothetical protein
MLQVPSHAESIAAQKNLEKEGWRKDPLKVAENHLTVILSGVPIRTGGKTEVLVPGKQDKNARRDDRPREQLLPVLSKAFYKSYEWIEANGTTHFYIVVTRPYWLRPFANSSDDVIWAVEGASVLQCPETQKTR